MEDENLREFLEVECIIRDKNVPVIYVEGYECPAATATKDGEYFFIIIDSTFLRKIRDDALRLAVEKGLRLHEAAHIAYDSFSQDIMNAIKAKEKTGNETFYKSLINLLEDVRIEGRLLKDYTSLVKYLSLVLDNIKLMANDKDIEEEGVYQNISNKEAINKQLLTTLRAVFQAVRFGEVDSQLLNKDTEEDLSFIVPRIFLARRGLPKDVVQAANEIYDYLDKKYGIPKIVVFKLEVEIIDGDELGSSSVQGGPGKGSKSQQKGKGDQKSCKDGREKGPGPNSVQVLPWKTRNSVKEDSKKAVEEAREALKKSTESGEALGGLLGGPDSAQLEAPTERDAAFYISTVEKYGDVIRDLTRIIINLKGKRWFTPSYDGEFNVSPRTLQGAYVDSFKVEDEGKYYMQMRFLLPDADIAFLEDQSGSTYSSMELFSSSVICLLEAIRCFKKIRSAVVGFGDGIRILKNFNEPVQQGRYYPFSSGGTPMGEAMEEVLKLNWRGNITKVLIILTDGYPNDWGKVDRALSKMKDLKIKTIAMCVGIEANEEYKTRFDKVYEVMKTEELPTALFQAFVENALIRRFE
jgi:uncharacterized protein YegL